MAKPFLLCHLSFLLRHSLRVFVTPWFPLTTRTRMDPLTQFAEQLLADGRRDREVLRRRWHVPSWKAEIEQIADTLERNPLLVPIVNKAINDELSRLAETIEQPASPEHTPTTEATPDADRQIPTSSDV